MTEVARPVGGKSGQSVAETRLLDRRSWDGGREGGTREERGRAIGRVHRKRALVLPDASVSSQQRGGKAGTSGPKP